MSHRGRKNGAAVSTCDAFPQPWDESGHRSVGGLIHPFPLLETQLRPLPSLLLKGTPSVSFIELSLSNDFQLGTNLFAKMGN